MKKVKKVAEFSVRRTSSAQNESELLAALRGPRPTTKEEIQAAAQRYEKDLDTADRYWLETVHKYTAGRRLEHAELAVADHAYELLEDACSICRQWNASPEGQICPVSALGETNWNAERYNPPICDARFSVVPTAEELAPFLAVTLPKPIEPISEAEAIERALSLFARVKKHLYDLPRRLPRARLPNDALLLLKLRHRVKLREIAESMAPSNDPERTNPRLPLLFKLTHTSSGKISLKGLKKSVLAFFAENGIASATDETPEQMTVALSDLCEMRWRRFQQTTRSV